MKLALALTICALIATSASASAECVITLRVNDSAPSYFKDESGNWTGFVVEQATAVITEAGCKAEYVQAPWPRGIRSIKEGKIDMMGMMSITGERTTFASFIGPHYSEIMKLVVAKESNYHIEKHDDLKKLPHKILLERNAYYGKEMQKLLQDESFTQKVIWTSQLKQSIAHMEKVTQGRLSGFLHHEEPGALKKTPQGVKYHPFVINASPVYFGISKVSVDPVILKRLEAAKRLNASGEFERILQKYQK